MFTRSVVAVVTMVAALSYPRAGRAERTEVSEPSVAFIPAGVAAFGLGMYLNLHAADEFRDGNTECLELFTGCNMKSLSGGALAFGGQVLVSVYGWRMGKRHASLGDTPPGALSQGALVLSVLGLTTSLGVAVYSAFKGIDCVNSNSGKVSSDCAGNALFTATIVQSVGQSVLFAALPFAAYRFGFKAYRPKTSPLVFLPMSPGGGGLGLVAASRF